MKKGFGCGPSSRKENINTYKSTPASPIDEPDLVDSLVAVLHWASDEYLDSDVYFDEDERYNHDSYHVIKSILAVDDGRIDGAIDSCWEKILSQCHHEFNRLVAETWPDVNVYEHPIAESIIQHILSRPDPEDLQKKALSEWMFSEGFMLAGERCLKHLWVARNDFPTQGLYSVGARKGYLLHLTIQHQLWDHASILVHEMDTDVNFVCGHMHDTVLHRIATQKSSAESVAVLKAFLQRPDINVNSLNADRFSALMVAATVGSVEVVESLLGDARVDANDTTEWGAPFITALRGCKPRYAFLGPDSRSNGRLENFYQIIELFLNHDHKTDFEWIDYEHLFHKHLQTRHVAEILKRSKLDINSAPSYGMIALHQAASSWNESDDKDKIELLLSHPGIDLNIKDEDGKTAAMVAVDKGNAVFGDLLQARLTVLEQEEAQKSFLDWGVTVDMDIN